MKLKVPEPKLQLSILKYFEKKGNNDTEIELINYYTIVNGYLLQNKLSLINLNIY